ncbi:MAG: efflux RND transporter permease subunit [Vulcanimicrobiaceae bacterium]
MTRFFLSRPIFAAVCSLVILIAGAIVLPTLPIAQYPRIAPPVVTVSANYIGASAQAVETSVTTPLEEAINGVEGLRYMSSTSTNDGTSSITCTFDLSRDLDRATADVQNAVQSAQGQLPAEVVQTGVTVAKNSGTFVMAIAMTSDNPAIDQIQLSNYAELNIKDTLKRIPGVSDVHVFGERKYAMRIWLDPRKLANHGLAATDVVTALQQQNVQVAAGAIGSPPTPVHQPYQISVHAEGRLATPQQFGNMVLKANPDGGLVRVRDVGRVELGAENYASYLKYNGKTATGLGVLQLPAANALTVANDVKAEMAKLATKFPAGVHYEVAFDSTTFVYESIKEVVITLFIAILLVILVIFLFLQDWRTTLIPAITIPVSLIGTFAVMKAFGFTINTITLFGLTLATGLVVDDAIVVIENIARFIQEKKMESIEGAAQAMDEIRSAVVASSLVLLAIFVPVAFFPGTTGQLYRQFALTIAAAISISLFNALTLTPTLSALLLGREEIEHGGFFRQVNRAIAASRKYYHGGMVHALRARWLVAAVFVAGLVATGVLYRATPTAFIPSEDQGYFIVTVQAPEGTSLNYETKVAGEAEAIIAKQPEVVGVFNVGGFSFSGAAPNLGLFFVRLKPWSERPGYDHSINAILGRIGGPLYRLPGVQVFAFNPPAIQGIGRFGGFQFELEDRANIGIPALVDVARKYEALGNRDPALSSVFTTFRNDSPQLQVDVNRDKAASLGVPLTNIFSTMQVYLGSEFVNNFDYLNRSYRVYVQADTPYRNRINDLQQIYVRSTSGAIMPIDSFISVHEVKTAPIITHYNLFRSIEISGQTPAGYGSGQSIAAMEALAKKVDPPGVDYEWTGISLEEIQSGGQSALIFLLGIVFVFLVLAAQYESFTDPLIVLLAVPLAIFGALAALGIRHIASDAYAQVGFLMLIGLASKSAILIVEFANQLRASGLDTIAAARQAAETRFRPIIMTSLAFVLAVVPLVFATGAGSGARHSIGTTVFGGMVVSTILNLFITPVIYVLVVSLRERIRPPKANGAPNGVAIPAQEREPVNV